MASNGSTSYGSEARISLSQLEQSIHAACENAYFVAPRVLRRVIKADRQITGFMVDAPHSKCFVVHHERMLRVADRTELHPRPDGDRLPDKIILIARPEEESLATISRDEALVRSWRLLFHSLIHLELETRLESGELTRSQIYSWIHDIGQGEFDEIRQVLRQERLLLPPYSDISAFVEFVAIFLELRFFAPGALVQYFPGLRGVDRLYAAMDESLGAGHMLEDCRPELAPDPKELTLRLFGGLDPEDAEHEPEPRSQRRFMRLMHKARVVASLGNTVRAAILRMKAAELTSPTRAERTRAEANHDIEVLVKRLRDALGFGEAESEQWHAALWALLEQCPRGVWTAEARLLYDLQKVCNDHEREIYTIDVVSWVIARGKRPIKRPLPSQRDVLMCKHLKGASSRLTAVRIAPNFRRNLSRLLGHASKLAEENLRRHFRPRLNKVLETVGLEPNNPPEAVAKKKLIEELIDRVAQHGFLTAGDLRDAISRNSLKVPDLSGVTELWHGDRLLRIDRQLAGALDGVYQPGEIYRRWFQRISAAAFGNAFGRLLTRFLFLPFLGAFVIIEGLRHLAHYIYHEEWLDKFTLIEQPGATSEPELLAGYLSTLGILGIFLLALLNSEVFRLKILKTLHNIWRWIGKTIEHIVAFYKLPLIQRMLRSRWLRLLGSVVIKPTIFTLIIWGWVNVWRFDGYDNPWLLVFVFFGANVITNSRFGRDMEEVTKDWAVDSWRKFRVHVLAGIFQLVMDAFKRFVEAVDRVLYSVDEWLRFRTGESTMAVLIKGVLGIVWFAVTYVTRFCVNLLIEPQINPIKHFPAVTVAHKILLPTIPLLAAGLEPLVGSTETSLLVATVVITCIPGVFGFLVWELKENWRLYEANRPRAIPPCLIGHHGETMIRLLKPGIHSGTLPKIYRRLRRAERKAQWTGERRSARKYLHQLSQVKHALNHFVDREFCQLLDVYPDWTEPVIVGEIRMASNSVHVELLCPSIGPDSLWLEFDLQSGWLYGRIDEIGWVAQANETQRLHVRNALLGMFKLSGVSITEAQIQKQFGAEARFDIVQDGLLVWPGPGYDTEWRYDLELDRMWPKASGPAVAAAPPVLSRKELMLVESPLAWSDWVAAWEPGSEPRPLLHPLPVLPSVVHKPVAHEELEHSSGDRVGLEEA